MNDERPFLLEIANDPDNLAARLVYADWLEERGECERAEFLRLDAELTKLSSIEPEFLRLNERFHDLHARLDWKWLALLDRTDIENCRLEFRFQCPARWEKLSLTDDQRVRFCDSCHREVFHCTSIQQAQNHAEAGHCVAIDSRLVRMPGDLDDLAPTTELELGDHVSGMVAGYLAPRPRNEDSPLLPPSPRKRWWQFWK